MSADQRTLTFTLRPSGRDVEVLVTCPDSRDNATFKWLHKRDDIRPSATYRDFYREVRMNGGVVGSCNMSLVGRDSAEADDAHLMDMAMDHAVHTMLYGIRDEDKR